MGLIPVMIGFGSPQQPMEEVMAAKMERKPFDKPDETRPFKDGKG
jgi:hypothetical protein